MQLWDFIQRMESRLAQRSEDEREKALGPIKETLKKTENVISSFTQKGFMYKMLTVCSDKNTLSELYKVLCVIYIFIYIYIYVYTCICIHI